MYARTLKASLAATAIIAASLIAVPAAAAPEDTEASARASGFLTLTVTRDSLSPGATYQEFVVPTCATRLAYVTDGAEGGSNGNPGYAEYANGGAGMIMSGVMTVTPGETLRLYPSEQGSRQGQFNDGGLGGTGYRSGGTGSTHWNGPTGTTTSNRPGSGGGGASAITAGTSPLVVAPGGGGAGGAPGLHMSYPNTGYGGHGGERGGNGANYETGKTNWAGAVGWTDDGHGETGQLFRWYGGAGGGGGGYRGGGAGGAAWSNQTGGGGGGGGTSFVETSRNTSASIADYGLSRNDLDPREHGAVRIAYADCGSTLNVQGTTTSADGTTGPASGWGQTVTAAGTVEPGTGTTDSSGSFVTTIGGFTGETMDVTVTQEERSGWMMQDWTATSLNTPLATCTVKDTGQSLTVTNLGVSSYRVNGLPQSSEVTCTSNTLEIAPDFTAVATATDTSTGTENPASVAPGAPVSYRYDLENAGNMPLNLSISDPKVSSLNCSTTLLMPGTTAICFGSNTVTAD